MSLDNKFFFIGEAQHSYAGLGNRFDWESFAQWLGDWEGTDPDNINCHSMFKGRELIVADGRIVGCFGGPLDRAPTPEELEAGENV